MMSSREGLQIILMTGEEAPQRAVLAMATALSAISTGVEVRIFFAMNGAHWLLKEGAGDSAVHGFPSMRELLEEVMQAGGILEVCSTCVEGQCFSTAPRVGGEKFAITGLSSVVERMQSCKTLTF